MKTIEKSLFLAIAGILACGCSKETRKGSSGSVAPAPSASPGPDSTVQEKVTSPFERTRSFDASNLFPCKSSGGNYLHGCSLTERQIAAAQPSAATFTVRYEFNCAGHRVDVGVASESDPGASWRFVQGPGVQSLRLRTVGPLRTKDFDAAATPDAEFAPGCALHVLGVDVAPEG